MEWDRSRICEHVHKLTEQTGHILSLWHKPSLLSELLSAFGHSLPPSDQKHSSWGSQGKIPNEGLLLFKEISVAHELQSGVHVGGVTKSTQTQCNQVPMQPAQHVWLLSIWTAWLVCHISSQVKPVICPYVFQFIFFIVNLPKLGTDLLNHVGLLGWFSIWRYFGPLRWSWHCSSSLTFLHTKLSLLHVFQSELFLNSRGWMCMIGHSLFFKCGCRKCVQKADDVGRSGEAE